MIIQALYNYYKILAADKSSGIPLPGYSPARVSFALNIDRDGNLLDVIDLRRQQGKKLVPSELMVPQQVKRASNIAPNFLSDGSSYVLGVVGEKSDKKPKRVKEEFEAFGKHHHQILQDIIDEGAQAVLGFLRRWEPGEAEESPVFKPFLKDIVEGGNLVFRLDGTRGYIHDRPLVREAWEKYQRGSKSEIIGQCMVTGERAPIARLHPNIKGVSGAQSSGAAIVSFNLKASESFNKNQSYNAPISEEVAFGYTTALNYLIQNKRQTVHIGDTTLVYWAEKPSAIEETLFSQLLFPTEVEEKEEKKDGFMDDVQTTYLVRDVLTGIKQGKPLGKAAPDLDAGIRFYILGLAPNAARLSIRFWHADTFGGIAEKIGVHHADLDIIRSPRDPEFISLSRILKSTAVLGENKNISPLLGGAVMRSILTGAPYPRGLYTAILSRIRAERKIDYTRAAILKACLIREARIYKRKDKEVMFSMSLNSQTTNTPYRLGRLFALLEKAQQDALPGINATIKDRYFGAASASPRSVFPQLLRLSQHHIAKAEYGMRIDRQIEEVLTGIESFPGHLNLEEQGLFFLGYYHQRQDFYQKNEKREG